LKKVSNVINNILVTSNKTKQKCAPMFLFHEKYFCWKWELHVYRIKPSTRINAFFKLLNNTLNAFVVECKILRRFFLFCFAHKILLDSIMSTKTFFKSLSAGWRCLTRNIPLKNKLFRRKKKKCFTETAFLHFFCHLLQQRTGKSIRLEIKKL
jgi:hypothetical protein